MAKFCAHCGTSLDEGTKFCQNCGSNCEAVSAKAPEAPQMNATMVNNPAPTVSMNSAAVPGKSRVVAGLLGLLMKRLKHTFVLGIFAIIFLLFYVFEFSWDCPIKKYLHFACPGCGLTRSIRALLNFNLIDSIKYNLLGIPLVISIIIISIFLLKDIINN